MKKALHHSQKSNDKPPLKLKYVLILPSIFLTSIFVLISSYLTWKYSEKTTARLGIKISKQSAYFVENRLDAYLGHANVSNNLLKNVIEYDLLDITNKDSALDYITNIVKKDAGIGTLSVAYPDGSYIGLSNTKNNRLLKKVASPDTNRMFYTYDMADNRIIQQRPNYDARVRPWFIEAKDSDVPVWSSVFEMFSSGKLGVTFSEALYKKDTFIGVIGTDVVFHDLNEQLDKIKITDDSFLFILDEKNHVIAQSSSHYSKTNQSNDVGLLYTVEQSDNPLLKQAFRHISANIDRSHRYYHANTQLTINDSEKQYFINYIPYTHNEGMNWHIGVVIPQYDLLGDINQIRTNTFFIWLGSFILCTIFGLVITFLITRSIRRLQKKLSVVGLTGVYKHGKHNIEEVNDLSLAFSSMSKRLQKSIITANTDPLTKLSNRRCFHQQLDSSWLDFEAKEVSDIILIALDIDHFKIFNDTYGHVAGDECLKDFAKVIEWSIEDVGTVARTGGEEFIIMLVDVTMGFAIEVAESIIENLKEANIAHKNSLTKKYVTTSMGIASCVQHGAKNKEEILNQADKALYCAKQNGRNCYMVYSS